MHTDNESQDGFKEIKPAPFNPATENTAVPVETKNISLKTLNITLGLAILLVSLVIVIFFLPSWVKNSKPADPTNTSTISVKPPTPETKSSTITPVVEPISPEEQARNLVLRKEAQTYLQEILDKQKALEENNAQVWAGEEYVTGLNHARKGDEFYNQQKFAEANQAYQQALTHYNPLYEQIDIIYQENIDNGLAALDIGESAQAMTAFKTAALFTDESLQANKGLERAQILDEVFTNIEQGNEALNEGQLLEAKTAYQTALKLDPETKLAKQKLEETNRLLTDKKFNAFMSAGYAALNQKSFTIALTKFNNALKIKPGASTAKIALEQTKHQATALDIANTLKQARISESNEQWQTAIDLYNNALKLEKNLAEAQTGKQRSEKRLAISLRLEQILSRPERLNDKKVHAETSTYYNKISTIENQGPALTKKLTELKNLLRVSATPVKIRLQSDNLTDVIVYKVGKMGLFETKELSLRPGKYIAIGKREGYRDVRIEFLVSENTSKQAIRIAAKEKIN